MAKAMNILWGVKMSKEFKSLVGRTLKNIVLEESAHTGKIEAVFFETTDGFTYAMRHSQDCCEHVYLEDICGDLEDLLGSQITQADMVQSTESVSRELEEQDRSYLWTFYKLATVKGYVTLRWFGSSNGYYSEGVDFEIVEQP